MSEYLDVMSERTADIRDASYELQRFARAFYATGNTVMGESLGMLAETLMDAQDEINKAVGKEINDRLHDSQQSAYNTVAACLAMTARERECA